VVASKGQKKRTYQIDDDKMYMHYVRLLHCDTGKVLN